MRYSRLLAVPFLLLSSCVVTNKPLDPTGELAEAKVRPGISVLMSDSINLIRGKRIGLITNNTGIDEKGFSNIDILRSRKARDAAVRLCRLSAPKHGPR